MLYQQPFELKELIEILLFIKPSTMPHMWYMPMIIGMYVFLPYISNIIQKFSFNEILIPIILSFLVIFVLPSLKVVSIFLNYTNLQFSSIIDITWAGGTYGIYIILGYYVWNKGILRKKDEVHCILYNNILSFLYWISYVILYCKKYNCFKL